MSAHHDLEWLAFRYISNEMSSEEAEAFEQRLADDQDAREAVSQSVQVSHALVTLSSNQNPVLSEKKLSPGPARSRIPAGIWSIGGIAVALAAICFAFLLGMQFHKNSSSELARQSPKSGLKDAGVKQSSSTNQIADTTSSDSIITAWLEVEADVVPVISGNEESLLAADSPDEGSLSPDETEENFDWLLAAIDANSASGQMHEAMEEK
ncbi:MAG: hypothetical protein Tsb009_24820 [Planctomycetaceae bacterium]